MSRNDDRQPFSFGVEPDAGAPRRRRAVPGWLKLSALIAAVAAAAAGYLYLVDPELGRRLLRGTPAASLAPPPAVTTVYKWRDATGSWQLTDRPPPAGTPYETVQARGARNVIPSERVTGQQTR